MRVFLWIEVGTLFCLFFLSPSFEKAGFGYWFFVWVLGLLFWTLDIMAGLDIGWIALGYWIETLL